MKWIMCVVVLLAALTAGCATQETLEAVARTTEAVEAEAAVLRAIVKGENSEELARLKSELDAKTQAARDAVGRAEAAETERLTLAHDKVADLKQAAKDRNPIGVTEALLGLLLLGYGGAEARKYVRDKTRAVNGNG